MRSKTVDRLLKSTPEDVKIFVDLYADLVVRINAILREKGMTKKDLAEKMDKKPSEISKWLSGEHNFTLRSLAKLSAELGEPLLEVPNQKIATPSVKGKKSSIIPVRMVSTKSTGKAASKDWQKPDVSKASNAVSNVG